jgi:hypothetical protein
MAQNFRGFPLSFSLPQMIDEWIWSVGGFSFVLKMRAVSVIGPCTLVVDWLAGSLFYDAFSVTRLYSFDDDKRMMLNWKGFGRKRSWPNIMVVTRPR